MDYEKAYKEALARARALNEGKTTGAFGETVCEYIFPELIVSADEKIRRTLLEHFRTYYEYNTIGNSITIHDIINWLEKQGKQNPADKVVQKFKVGDWISNNMCDVHIASIEDGMYYFDEGDGLSIVFVDEHYHLWTIEDAMDGDVLAYGDNPNDCHVEVTMIFKSVRNEISAFTHFHFFDDKFRVNDWCDCGKNTHPATKKQRDTLFAKMKEAGYEWDDEKKEVKLLITNGGDF